MYFISSLIFLMFVTSVQANTCTPLFQGPSASHPFQEKVSIDPKLNILYLQLIRRVHADFQQLPVSFHPKYFPLILNELNHRQKAELTNFLQFLSDNSTIQEVPWNQFILGPLFENYVNQINELREKHKLAVGMSLALHDGTKQKYGTEKYSYHIKKLRAIAKRFGFGPKNSIFGLKLGTVLWLHDAPEDKNLKFTVITSLLGTETTYGVWGMTNIPKSAEHRELSKKCKAKKGETKNCSEEELRILAKLDEENKIKTLERTEKHKLSRIGKLIDRTGNVEESLMGYRLGRPSPTYDKYVKEWPLFKKYLYRTGEADELWIHLEKLLTDEDYAQKYIWARFTRGDIGT
ncbi:MAG TPA: hypothetical protein PLJ21_00935 [Pseudobdellovibrionaceae bacterium]|nr:hypothetical protein [Pseudobdellovibrionaceae bacterium]